MLASEMQASSKGARLGQWMLKHEEALKSSPTCRNPSRVEVQLAVMNNRHHLPLAKRTNLHRKNR